MVLLLIIVSGTVMQDLPAAAAAGQNTHTNTNQSPALYEDEIQKALEDMPLLPITSAGTIRACRLLPPLPSSSSSSSSGRPRAASRDIFICSYPKSGTTWTQNIVVRILWELTQNRHKHTQTHNEDDEDESYVNLPQDWHVSHSAPFYEVDQYWRQPQPQQTEEPKEGIAASTSPPLERVPVKTPLLVSLKKKKTTTTLEKNGATPDDPEDASMEYRVFNTHLRPHQLPAHAKCLYILRQPMDVLVSFYHHLSNQSPHDGGYVGSYADYCAEFLQGQILYGKWQDHIEAWLTAGSTKNNKFLLLHYEDMKHNLEHETKRIARFLLDDDDNDNDDDDDDDDARDTGTQHLDLLVDQLRISDRVVPYCTFAAMKRDSKLYTPLSVQWNRDPTTGQPYTGFIRTGLVGDPTTSLSKLPTQALQDQWLQHDVYIAQQRWRKAQIDPTIIQRYLS